MTDRVTRTRFSPPQSGLAAELASHIIGLAPVDDLDTPDPALAAQQFHWLVLSIHLNQAMFDSERRFSRAGLHRDAAAESAPSSLPTARTEPRPNLLWPLWRSWNGSIYGEICYE